MARNSVQAERRRRELARMLSRDGEVSTAEAAELFGVSDMTIRRDLEALEESGVAVRSYGGAVAAQRISFEFAFDERRRRNLPQKRSIGRHAAGLIDSGRTVFLDTGTTTLQVAEALSSAAVECTVATSSLVIASTLWGRQEVDLILVGGRVRRGSPDLVGPGTELMLDRLTADIAFVGSDGIDPERGSFAGDMETARVAERMAANARRVVVVADSSKLGSAGGARYVATEGIDELITDSEAGAEAVEALKDRGVKVTLV
jgi:DeoR/GlpR family transcriptional regulator of sugar metabolism